MVVDAGNNGWAAENAGTAPEAAADELQDGGAALRATHDHIWVETLDLLRMLGDRVLKVRRVPDAAHREVLKAGAQVERKRRLARVSAVRGSAAVHKEHAQVAILATRRPDTEGVGVDLAHRDGDAGHILWLSLSEVLSARFVKRAAEPERRGPRAAWRAPADDTPACMILIAESPGLPPPLPELDRMK